MFEIAFQYLLISLLSFATGIFWSRNWWLSIAEEQRTRADFAEEQLRYYQEKE